MATGVHHIDALHLAPDAEAGALRLYHLHPGVVFTSGRRDIHQQAHAMAVNTVLAGRHWIEHTYHSSHASRACQNWVNENPHVTGVEGIASGLFSVLMNMTTEQLAELSAHLGGEAFDVQPGSCPVNSLYRVGARRVLTHEGGLRRWHLQF
jgi:hypothetical protein